ncbi:hypothetical protein C3B44_03195 [Corynebacterium yudongzhengii]|uniref:YtxH domain-containing protein n=1 Tax=Corynebacterium yudongzhengii TaxID=2080740 RepID=A0A2U1T7G2_9CORY|nr:hypothetical protein [Corynebacterium yudongzhengii]AWB81483.1 hypothetical protein C3B44_03195 [Corynebacterium yudongzhengii]PWC01946.1 hypothetical protein DF222_05050 [Corynebacterium yudongzhengii]
MIQFVIGAAAGYVIGTKAGRKRYRQLKKGAETVINSPVTRQVVISTRKAVANKLDPQPRMREVKNLRKDSRTDGQTVLEHDED